MSKKLGDDVKRGINYIIGLIIKCWPADDVEAIQNSHLSLVTGYSFYYECFRSHLEPLKNLECHGRTFAPHDEQASGVSVILSYLHVYIDTCFAEIWV